MRLPCAPPSPRNRTPRADRTPSSQPAGIAARPPRTAACAPAPSGRRPLPFLTAAGMCTLVLPSNIEYAMPYARIAITLPKDLVAAADRRAREIDRSRSRVIAAALRAYLDSPPPPAQVREPVRPAYGSDAIGSARRAQLERDLARTPAQRLAAAEQLARLARGARPRARRPRQQIIGFDSYEDFYEWKKTDR